MLLDSGCKGKRVVTIARERAIDLQHALFLIRIYRYFNDSILSVFKDIVGFFDF